MLEVSVPPRRLLKALLTVVAVLVVLSLAADVLFIALQQQTGLGGQSYYTFGLGRERNLPTWWSGLQLGVVGLLCLQIGLAHRAARQPRTWAWFLLAAAFLYVSFDEVVRLHEELSGPVSALTGRTDGVFAYGWVFVALPVVAVLLAVLAPFLRALPRGTRRSMLVAGVVYVTGAVGAEIVGSLLVSAGATDTSWSTVAEYTVEETLEMTGVALFLVAVVRFRQHELAQQAERSARSDRGLV